MKSFLKFRSKRFYYDGWALQVDGASKVLDWTVCTTREEARELLKERFQTRDFLQKIKIVKVKITVERK
jgi:hypothetical protein